MLLQSVVKLNITFKMLFHVMHFDIAGKRPDFC